MKNQTARIRKGIECVEVAVTLPLLFLATFATVEITHRWHMEKMLKFATYEAVKAGCASNGDAEDAEQVFREHTAAMGIENARLIFNRSEFQSAETGQLFRFRGVAPSKNNQIVKSPIDLPLSRLISSGHIFYRKEGL